MPGRRGASGHALAELKNEQDEIEKAAADLKSETAGKLDAARANLDAKLEKLKKASEAAERELKK